MGLGAVVLATTALSMSGAAADPIARQEGFTLLYGQRGGTAAVLHNAATPSSAATCALIGVPPAKWAILSVEVTSNNEMALFVSDQSGGVPWPASARLPLMVTLTAGDRVMRFSFRMADPESPIELISEVPRAAIPGVMAALSLAGGFTLSLQSQEVRYTIPHQANETFRVCVRSLLRERMERLSEEARRLIR